ncbi:MAG: RNA methyltransferase [Desulfurococcales archaeon]|nr:RNA methyltransferase [Desulfurococcales archaeon]
MRRVRVVIVEPEGKINMGFIIRLAKNFAVDDLCVVNPKFPIDDPEVAEFSAKASDYLSKVRVERNLKACLKGASLTVCTTSKGHSEKDVLRQGVQPSVLRSIADDYEDIALVFGRESVGLTREELKQCDVISSLSTGDDYNVMNLSHAVAIYLYVFRRMPGENITKPCNPHTLEAIRKLLASLAELVRDEREVIALKHLIFRGGLRQPECGAIYKFLKEVHAVLLKSHSKSLKNP